MKRALVVLGVLAMVLAEAPSFAEVEWDLIGMVRARGDLISNFSDLNDDDKADNFAFWPYRAMLGVDADFGNGVHGVVAFQNASAFGLFSEQRDTAFSNFDNFDLFLANIDMREIGGTNNNLTIGRQRVVYGNEFLLGDLDFYNGTSHDGIMYSYASGRGPLSVFWMQNSETFGARADAHLWGVDKTWNEGLIPNADLSVYAVGYRDVDLGEGFGGADSRISSYWVGARITSDPPAGSTGFWYSFEITYNGGTIGKQGVDGSGTPNGSDADIKAYGSEGWFGYRFGNNRFFIKYYYATGDSDPGDNDKESFDPLFQNFHDRLGKADAFFGSNISSFSIGYNFDPDDSPHGFGAEWLWFRLNETTQATQFGSDSADYRVTPSSFGFGSYPGDFPSTIANPFGSTGIVVTPQGILDQDSLGWELDLWYDYDYNENLSFQAGLAYFSSGDALDLATAGGCGPGLTPCDDAATRIWGQARLDF